MAMVKITTVESRGQNYDVSVDEEGKFFADCGDEQIKADSLDQLRGKLNRVTLLTKNKLAIAFVDWYQGRIRHGVCTGKHATNHNLLVKYDGGKTEQVGRWGNDDTRLDPKVAAQYAVLCKSYDVARELRRDFEKKHALNLDRLVDKAYEAAEESAGGAA